ncbi:phosphonatase-like hydrolase [Catalinimonas alkaloidigena]|uniref:HAD hydrolase-like protein n=1 Tax=Catalinimonas alkaloidigena TaxID=1075417 RepID=UPI002404FD9B|nr:HAD hydrolase-like protein [Catalinimonas alkaloidigena]MDF9798427.1 phosphonatase-like hydrolase [Catalinimonas alkaloidigena]
MKEENIIQLVVFDMAGTTVEDKDSVQKALQNALSRVNIKVALAETVEVMGYPKPEAIRILLEQKLEDQSKITPDYIEEIHQYFVQDMVKYYQQSPQISEKAGVSDTFKILRNNNIKIALDTGFSRPIADAIIDRLHWRDKIDVSITSDEVENGRPYPDMIYKAMKLTGVQDVKQVAKVGDTASDMQQGMDAGCKYVIGVTTGNYTEEELKNYEHTHLIAQLPEILEILGIASEKVA